MNIQSGWGDRDEDHATNVGYLARMQEHYTSIERLPFTKAARFRLGTHDCLCGMWSSWPLGESRKSFAQKRVIPIVAMDQPVSCTAKIEDAPDRLGPRYFRDQ